MTFDNYNSINRILLNKNGINCKPYCVNYNLTSNYNFAILITFCNFAVTQYNKSINMYDRNGLNLNFKKIMTFTI